MVDHHVASSALPRRPLLAAPTGLLLPTASPDGSLLGLHARAAPKGLFYGCAVSTSALTDDPVLTARIAADCGMLVAEYAFKWAALHPGHDQYDWKQADTLMTFAASHGMRVRGHTLVWHASNPDWLAAALTTPTVTERILREHIGVVVGRYRDRIAHWDVVNEPLRLEDGLPFDLRRHLWLTSLGPAYFDIAFDACQMADPTALRVLNEFGLDYAVASQQRRRQSVLRLLASLLDRKVPVDALGMQAHLDGAETAFDPAVMTAFLDDVADLGLKVIVTELDVRDDRLPADVALRDVAVAAQAGLYLRTVLAHKAVLGVLTWGLSDKGTWLNQTFPRTDGLPQRPLPCDEACAPKPMWRTIAQTLDMVAQGR
jgi:endo-1,4-beta-xylanase